MRIIYYKVAVSPEEEKDFHAMEDLALIYDKDYEEIIMKMVSEVN